MKSDTPITDNAVKTQESGTMMIWSEFVSAETARSIERDLNRLQKIISDATRSKCCGAKMIVSGGKDGTRWHECTKCGGACDGYINVAAMPNAGAEASATRDTRTPKTL